MKPLIEQIREIKTEAKNLRDLGIEGYEDAVAALQSAIKLATDALAEANVQDIARQMAKELADCFGMVGGVQRRWAIEGDAAARFEHLAQSCKAYDAGWRYEWNEKYDIRASYNLVNRLTGRLLIRPDLLRLDDTVDLGGGIPPLHLPHELADAMARIKQHLAKKGNLWAEADLALLKVLLGDADVAAAYAPFYTMSPPGYAYTSALDGLRPLAASALETAAALKAAVAMLEARRTAA